MHQPTKEAEMRKPFTILSTCFVLAGLTIMAIAVTLPQTGCSQQELKSYFDQHPTTRVAATTARAENAEEKIDRIAEQVQSVSGKVNVIAAGLDKAGVPFAAYAGDGAAVLFGLSSLWLKRRNASLGGQLSDHQTALGVMHGTLQGALGTEGFSTLKSVAKTIADIAPSVSMPDLTTS
jgi:uncharacterized protein YfiM (DUF2279 family)